MREYVIYYTGTEDDQEIKAVGSGFGENESEAIKDFLFWHDDCKKIESVEFYR